MRIAKDPYYGPGYGPFIAARWEAEAPDFADGGRITLALEIRGGERPGVRAGSSVDGGEWVWTE